MKSLTSLTPKSPLERLKDELRDCAPLTPGELCAVYATDLALALVLVEGFIKYAEVFDDDNVAAMLAYADASRAAKALTESTNDGK